MYYSCKSLRAQLPSCFHDSWTKLFQCKVPLCSSQSVAQRSRCIRTTLVNCAQHSSTNLFSETQACVTFVSIAYAFQKELMVDSSISVKHQIPEVQMADVSSNISDTPKVEEPAPTPVEEKKPEPDKHEKQQTPEAMEEDKSEHIKTEEVPLKQQPAVSEPESQPAVTDSPKPEQPETKEATESPSPMSVEPPPRTDVLFLSFFSNNMAKTPSTQNFIVEIKKVADRVDSLKPQIQQLHENSELLNLRWQIFMYLVTRISELSRNPLEGVKQVEKLQKKSLEYSEYLMRDLLALDKIDSNQAVRPMRKGQNFFIYL